MNETTEPTPGPWYTEGGGFTISACGRGLATVSYRSDIDAANATLMAAAPDLLAACKIIRKDMRNELSDCGPTEYDLLSKQIKYLSAAIDKAELGI